MIKVVYQIEVWNEDEIYGKGGIFISNKEYSENPTESDILKTLEKYNCEFAKVQKVFKKVSL